MPIFAEINGPTPFKSFSRRDGGHNRILLVLILRDTLNRESRIELRPIFKAELSPNGLWVSLCHRNRRE
jgi:hypothetical protein